MARVTVDASEIDGLVDELAEAYYRGPAQRVKAQMRANSPKLTGLMSASHSVDPPIRDGRFRLIRFRVEADRAGFPYPIAVHEGRGEVRPVRRRALRWVNRAGVVVFATRSRATRPNPWLWRTFVQLGFRNARRIPR